jgi:hypothetical protein
MGRWVWNLIAGHERSISDRAAGLTIAPAIFYLSADSETGFERFQVCLPDTVREDHLPKPRTFVSVSNDDSYAEGSL